MNTPDVIIRIFPDKTWTMEFSKDASKLLIAACVANMDNNLQAEIEYFEDDPDLIGDNANDLI